MEQKAAGDTASAISTAPASAAAAAAVSQCPPAIPMADKEDATDLSENLAFLRRQLEYFEATTEDVQIRQAKGGRHRTVHAGQVGIRCVHCAHRLFTDRPAGAVAFPTSIGLVYQAVRNWQSKSMCIYWFFMFRVGLPSLHFRTNLTCIVPKHITKLQSTKHKCQLKDITLINAKTYRTISGRNSNRSNGLIPARPSHSTGSIAAIGRDWSTVICRDLMEGRWELYCCRKVA